MKRYFYLSSVLASFIFISSCNVKPKANFLGIKKGKIDKITFLSGKEIQLTGANDSIWKVVSYEFNYSCKGEITMKGYRENKIPREVLLLVKKCDGVAIADFTNIIATRKNSKKTFRLNDIRLTVE
ncbi:MAG: hypothetical protein ACK5D5_06515 [Bacteroidota bacterium]|jgi:hypothetical protein